MKILGKESKFRNLSHINPKVRLRKNRFKENGLFAKKNIRKGEIIHISAGIGLSEKAVKKLPKTIQKYCFYAENGFFYCPLNYPTLSAEWFINHSCNPNTAGELEFFTLRAKKNIKKGEEITYDYAEDYKFWKYRPFRKFKCYCGAKNCRKIIRY